MARVFAFLYGIVAYAIFFLSFLYLIGFLGNFVVPKSIDSGVGAATGVALLVNLGLLALFGIQHSVMARPGFKKWWTSMVPKSVERSTYVLLSSVALIALFVFWQPMGGVVWNVTDPAGVAVLVRFAVQILRDAVFRQVFFRLEFDDHLGRGHRYRWPHDRYGVRV